MFSLPASTSLSLFWNFGSLLGVFMVFQILTGFFMVFYYSAGSLYSFYLVQYIMYEVSFGWILRVFHMNGSSFLFFFVYFHFFKNMFMGSNKLTKTWSSGILMLIVLMGVAFMGYSLVWSQMSYWAVVVITSLVSVIPFIGFDTLLWVWGGFSVGSGTLKLFFALHFIFPFLLLIMIIIHLLFLHETGSSSSLSYNGLLMKKSFNPYYTVKDLYNFFWACGIFSVIFLLPYILGDCELFLKSNSLTSPVHIAPEWYFCTFYAILRSIPNKTLGVLAMLMTLVELISLSFGGFKMVTSEMKKPKNFFISVYVTCFIILGWLGQSVAEDPFILLSFIGMIMYFLTLFLLFLL